MEAVASPPVSEVIKAPVDCDSVIGVANMLFAAWKAGKQLPQVAFTYLPAQHLQEAILEFAKLANIGPLDEVDLVCKHCLQLAAELRDFVSYTLLSRRSLKADVPFLRGTMVLSLISRDRMITTPESVVSFASDFFMGCLRVYERQADRPELRWTLAPPIMEQDGTIGTGLSSCDVRMRDLFLPPGLTPMRKLARDPQSVRASAITTEMMDRWRNTHTAQARIRQRNKDGMDTTKFEEAWRRRVNLENPYEMRASLAALRALRATAAINRLNTELGAIGIRCRISPAVLLMSPDAVPKGVARAVADIRVKLARANRYVSDNEELAVPKLYVRYANAYAPTVVDSLYEADPALAGFKALPVSKIVARPDADMLITRHASLMADMRDLVRCHGQWSGPFSQNIQNADFNVDTGLWDIQFEGNDDVTTMPHDQFQMCKWYVRPQMIQVGRPLRDEDFAFSVDGVRFYLGWWRH